MKIVSDVTRAGLMNPVFTHCGFLRYFIACLAGRQAGRIVMRVRRARDFNLTCSQLLAASRFADNKQHSPAINISQARYFRFNSDYSSRGFMILN